MLKSNNKRWLLVVVLLCFLQPLPAEESAEEMDEQTYQTDQHNSLLFYELFPLDARYASRKQWQDFYFLSQEQIDKLSNANIKKEFDLKKIGINPQTLENLLPYLTFNSGSIYLLSRVIDQQKYHENQSYLSHSQKLFFHYKNSRMGFLLQKDAGETDHLDYKNWFFQQTDFPYLTNIILGSYKLRTGQGIIFGNRLSQTISSLSTRSPIATSTQISPYTSFTEQWYLHGGTFTAKLGKLHLSPYYSQSQLDVNLTGDSISSFDESGLHLEDSPITTLTTSGVYSQWVTDRLELGYNATEFAFDRPFLDESQSQSYQVHSFDFRYQPENTAYFGEVAQADGKSGQVYGIKNKHSDLHQTIIYRNFEKNLPTHMGKPITQTNSFDNQKGIYYGALWLPVQNFKLNFYLDIWQTPQTSDEAQMPLSGQEMLFWGRYSSPKQYFSLQYKNQKKEQLLTSQEIGDQIICDYKADYHLHLGRLFKIKTRYNYRTYQETSHQSGYLTYAELGFRHWLCSIIGRATYYKAKTPVYMYQQGVDGTMLTTAFSGEDLFYYLLITSKILPNTKLQLKYSDYYKKTQRQELTAQILYSQKF